MLDPVNILLVTVLSSIMSLAILGSLRPAGIPGAGRWIGAYLMASVALLLAGLQRLGLPFLTVFVSNTLLALAVVRLLEGCRQFFGLKPRVPLAYAGTVALATGIVWWYWVTPSLGARVAVVSAFHAAIYASLGWLSLRCRPPERPVYSYRFVTLAAWLGAFAHALRGVMYGSGFVKQYGLLDFTPLNVAWLALGILVLPSLSIGMVLLAHDRMAERLERLANQDELTGALTRRAFLAQANASLEAAREKGQRVAFAIVDIDHFKSINDRYGHATGDRVLAQFCRVVKGGVRAEDVFGRLGGEEFALLFVGMSRDDVVTRLDELRVLTLSVRRSADAHARESGQEAHDGLTFSAGLDELQAQDSLATLMARADAALYVAKSRGRDRVVAI
ncbi:MULTISPECIES: GGDEF domain-containing protein [unclassified Paraburkholderia]|uniref:GGDEF domain-containing protein n=1 Tax=unclassified Paraburkholderia TaxID=2615204 RepID=UPI0020B68108|nr:MULTISPECIES: GGDEF domain-containing protein [unclassified Paraburkholderia]MCP3719104.1 GGDEF domain-containing protein [Paraburkholderia sp. CNPSo 3281]MCX5538237.1 GGDEF domain-containing protein [Paraburkholderia sp. CNPSo 3076]